jgi:hypothetical protein
MALSARLAWDANIAFTLRGEPSNDRCAGVRPRSRRKLPLTTWFLAIYLVTQSKNDISALELSRQLGATYDTAWIVKQKLMTAMGERNDLQVERLGANRRCLAPKERG